MLKIKTADLQNLINRIMKETEKNHCVLWEKESEQEWRAVPRWDPQPSLVNNAIWGAHFCVVFAETSHALKM